MLCHWVPYSLFSGRTRSREFTASATHSHFPSLSFSPNRNISCMDATGLDSNGREFKTADEMWREHTGDPSKKTQWYRDGVSYWEVYLSLFLMWVSVFSRRNSKKLDISSGVCCN